MINLRKPPSGYKNGGREVLGPEAFEGSDWADYIKYLEESLKAIKDEGGVDIIIVEDVNWGDYCASDYYAWFFVPMTESELRAKEKRNAKRRAAAKEKKAKQLEKERKEFERLKKKFEE